MTPLRGPRRDHDPDPVDESPATRQTWAGSLSTPPVEARTARLTTLVVPVRVLDARTVSRLEDRREPLGARWTYDELFEQLDFGQRTKLARESSRCACGPSHCGSRPRHEWRAAARPSPRNQCQQLGRLWHPVQHHPDRPGTKGPKYADRPPRGMAAAVARCGWWVLRHGIGSRASAGGMEREL